MTQAAPPTLPRPLPLDLQFPQFLRSAAALCSAELAGATEDAARAECARSSSLLSVATAIINRDGKVLYCSHGNSPENSLLCMQSGQDIGAVIEQGNPLGTVLERVLRSGQPDGYLAPDGTSSVLLLPLYGGDSRLAGVACVATAAETAHPAVDVSLYLALFNLLPTSVVLLDLSGHVRDVNPAFCRWMGFSREEVIGSHVRRFSADAPEKIEANLERLRSGETLEHEVINRQKDGAIRHYEIRERAVDLPDGTRGILVVTHDITDRKIAEAKRLELERSVLRAQKLESLGVLAGGIAHDFNNLLTVVLGHLDLAVRAVPESSPVQENLKQTCVAAKRAAELTRQMLAYSGRGRFVVQSVNLDSLLANTLESVRPSFPRRTDLQVSNLAAAPCIEADPVQIVQVLKNLLQNAAESLPETGGSIKVTLGMARVDLAHLPGNRTDLPVVPGRYATVEIADSGAGMTEEVRQRMFDPFFTTKFAGRGLGLAAVLGIVRGHGGALFVDSGVGRGTTVRVLFPAPESMPLNDRYGDPSPAVEPSSSLLAEHRGNILLAEDDHDVRDLLERLLRSLGLDVTAVPNGERAIEVFAAAPDRYAFSLLDLTLPGISGLETLARLRQIRPDFMAVLTSGYQRETIHGCQGEAGFIDFIPKPCDTAVFKRIVAGVCDRLGLPRHG